MTLVQITAILESYPYFLRPFLIMMNLNQQVINQVERAKNILVTFPIDWNGDALAGALACGLFLRKLGKNVELAAEKLPEAKSGAFNFLPQIGEIKGQLENLAKFIVSIDISNAKVDQIKYTINDNKLNFIISPKEGWFDKDEVKASSSGYRHDLIIVLGASDLESLGRIYDNNVDFFYKTSVINIDHNAANEEYGQINLIELNSVSVTEVLFNLFKEYRPELIDNDIATCLLTGIIYKTKSFKTPNLTPQALAVTSELITLGARREEIVNHLYRSRPLNVLRLWGRVLNNLESNDTGQLIWSKLYQDDFSSCGASESDINEVMDELASNTPQAQAIVLFYSLKEMRNLDGQETSKENNQTVVVHDSPKQPIFQTKAVIHTFKNISALDLAKEYQANGVRKAAYFQISAPLQPTLDQVIKLVGQKLDKMGG